MGIDVEIYFVCEGEPNFERALPRGFEICKAVDWKAEDFAPDATHCIDTMSRYYGIGYERGDWTAICAVLMLLIASEQVSKVYYGGDSYISLPECTIESVLEISKHYMENEHRPYRNR